MGLPAAPPRCRARRRVAAFRLLECSRDVVIAQGLGEAEMAALVEVAAQLAPGVEVVSVASVASDTLAEVAGASRASGATAPPAPAGPGAALAGEARVVLAAGAGAASRMAQLQAGCEDLGVAPAVYAAAGEGQEGFSAAQAVAHAAARYAAAHALFVPCPTGAAPAALDPAASVAMHAVLDSGTVPTPAGGTREDASHVLVLDNMYTEDERLELMEWLTGGTDDAGGPDPARWDQTSCQDFDGAAQSWGLTEGAVAALLSDPPPAVAALHSRLGQLYPDHHVCHMPSGALRPPEEYEDDDDPGLALSPFVANAVAAGTTYDWHLDMDPGQLHPYSPWAVYHGLYVNREPSRPLFATAMVYPQSDWPAEWDAETLFLDPGTGAGVLVRPAPYRVVLMDQDVCHRISAPAARAGRPRYSLVWKLVLVPRGAGAGATLAREGWGEPMRFGSARPGVPVAAGLA